MIHPPAPEHLPAHDSEDPVETAVVTRLAASWQRRASVKKPDLADDADPDPSRPEYPDELIPFGSHPGYTDLPPRTRELVNAWGAISFNKGVADIEQYVVNPGFRYLTDGAFDAPLSDAMTIAASQAMVDEQYHTLMHKNASMATRARRAAPLPDSVLPPSLKVRAQTDALATAEPADHPMICLAFTTVAEVSINTYLELLAGHRGVQPFTAATAEIHSRDEYCHSSIAAELAAIVFESAAAGQRAVFIDAVGRAVDGFVASDPGIWAAALDAERVPGAADLLRDGIAAAPRQITDVSGVHKLCRRLDIAGQVPVEWPDAPRKAGA